MGNSPKKASEDNIQAINDYNSIPTTEVDINREILRLKLLLEKSAEKGAIHDKLGYILYRRDMIDQAAYHLFKAWDLDSTTSMTSYYLGKIKESKKAYVEAIVFYNDSIKKNPKNGDAYQKVAECFMMIGNIEKALQYSLESLGIKENNADMHNLVGLCYSIQRNFDKALEHLQRATILDPSHSRAFNNLGNLMRKMNQNENAIHFYKLAIKNSNTLYVAFLNLGSLLMEEGDIWNGLCSLKESLKGGKEIALIIQRKGFNLFFMDEELMQAIKLFYDDQISVSTLFLERAYNKNPNNLIANFFIGIIKYTEERYIDASHHFNLIIKIVDPYLTNKAVMNPCLRLLYEKSKDYLIGMSDKINDTINLSEFIGDDKAGEDKDKIMPTDREQYGDGLMIKPESEPSVIKPQIENKDKSRSGLSSLSCSNIVKDHHQNNQALNTSGNLSFK